ncbi:MAG: hypothetical protein CBC05_08725 [Crocinitomicaceae bacterium TMED45]|nr:MAG: hypothetical protein CBC05_08725 [Crocinitomicaceae bacterium TMED45]|tara:strand:- start:11501 stop:11770 length:270 start_codon:yes stop_codon:yes gene_type:complete
MKIKLGLRGSTDAINHIIIKIDDLMLVTADNLFLVGEENRIKTGKNLIELLDTLSKDHEISVGKNIAKEIERELNLENQELQKFIVDKV